MNIIVYQHNTNGREGQWEGSKNKCGQQQDYQRVYTGNNDEDNSSSSIKYGIWITVELWSLYSHRTVGGYFRNIEYLRPEKQPGFRRVNYSNWRAVLFPGTFYRTIGTKHTAVTWFGQNILVAELATVHTDSHIRRNNFLWGTSTMRAGENWSEVFNSDWLRNRVFSHY